MSKVLKMKFDISTIKHLGVNLYSTLPPILSELIANAWDADATEVTIYLNDQNEKNIIIKDNGVGMSFKEINEHFLIIGRNRRQLFNITNHGRKAIGKKGLGKLSIFGIANEVNIRTIKDKKINEFKLNYSKILSSESNNEYLPEIIVKDKNTEESNGTTITLTSLKRKSSFDIEGLMINLARGFSLFSTEDNENKNDQFVCEIVYNAKKYGFITEKLKYNGINHEFIWEYPNDFPEIFNSENIYAKKITGKVMTNKSPLKATENGISLFSRGKLVQTNTFFENRANDHAHQYMVGFFNVDFIDEYTNEELISTDRKSLTWENEILEPLKDLMNQIIRKVGNEWKNKRECLKKKDILEKYDIDLDKWINSLDKIDRNLASSLTKNIVTSKLDTTEATELVKYIKDMFTYKSFKNFASELISDEEIDSTKLLKFFKEWELIEATELANLAKARLLAIKNLEELIDKNAKEVPEIHNFLKKFPWILDPRIVEFKDEVRYSEILKENFPNDKLEENDKRIDFLCHSTGETLYVIEIKRPKVKVGKKQLDQLKEYLSFVQDKILATSDHSLKKVIGYIISNELENSTYVKRELENNVDYFYFKRYEDMLRLSKKYHQEFIDKKNELEKNYQ